MRCARQAAACLELEVGRPRRMAGEIAEKFEKRRSEIDPETMQKSGFRGCPGALWRHPGWSWGVWGRFLKIWWRFLAKLGRRWAQDGRKMGQVGSKLRPRWAMMAPRWPSWAQFGSFWGVLGTFPFSFFASIGQIAEVQKRPTLHHFWCFFGGWGLLWRVLEAVLGAFWGLCWKMLAPRWCFLGYLRRCLDILAPRLANKGARCSR